MTREFEVTVEVDVELRDGKLIMVTTSEEWLRRLAAVLERVVAQLPPEELRRWDATGNPPDFQVRIGHVTVRRVK